MLKTFLIILLAGVAYGQSIFFKPIVITIESKDLGVLEASATPALDSLLVTVSTRRAKIDSIWGDTESVTIYDSLVIYGDSTWVYFEYDKSTVGNHIKSIYVKHSGVGEIDTGIVSYTVIPSAELIAENLDYDTLHTDTPITLYSTLYNYTSGTITFDYTSGLSYPFVENALPASINSMDSVEYGIVIFPSSNGSYLDTLVIHHSGGTTNIICTAVVDLIEQGIIAPQNFTASLIDGEINLSWINVNDVDTTLAYSYDFSISSQLDDFIAGWESSLSLENNKLKITDIGATQYPGAQYYLDVQNDKTYKITVDGYKGTATSVGLWVTDSATMPNPGYYNANFTKDTSFSVIVSNPTYDKLVIQLQGYTPSGGYVYHDNLKIYSTTNAFDGWQLVVRSYYGGVPNSDWTTLKVDTAGNSYVYTPDIEQKYGYKVRYWKAEINDTVWSNYSLEDTVTYSIAETPIDTTNTIVASKDDGTYDYGVIVRLESSLAGADIYYTVDGSTPTTSSEVYFKPIILENTTTSQGIKILKAFATDGTATSDIITKTYTLNGKYTTQTITTGTAYFEAEGSAYNEGVIKFGEDDFASNDAYAIVADQIADEISPAIILKFTPSTTGTYYFWARIAGLHSNSYGKLTIAVDGGSYGSEEWGGVTFGDSSKFDGFGLWWQSMQSEALTTGHTYSYKLNNRWTSSETTQGLIVDRVCITTSSSYKPPVYQIISPSGGERWSPNTVKDIVWGYAGSSSNVKIEYTKNDTTWNTIISSTTNDGIYSWTTPTDTGTTYRIRITDADGSGEYAESINNFIITNVANPYNASLTFQKDINVDISLSQSLLETYNDGSGRYKIAVNAHFTTGGNDITGRWAAIPYTEKIDTFFADNNNTTLTVMYNNMQTVGGVTLGEGVIPRIDYDNSWHMMYYPKTTPADSQWYYRSEGGDDRYGIYFISQSYENRLFDNIQQYYTAGAKSFYWDSFQPNMRFTYENKQWLFGSTEVYLLNRTTNQPFRYNEWCDGLKKLGYNISKRLDKAYGKDSSEQWVNSKSRLEIMNDDYYIDGYVMESWGGVSLAAATPVNFLEYNILENHITSVLLALRKNRKVVLLTDTETDTQTDSQGRFYDFCAMLFGITGPESPVYLSTWDGSVPFNTFAPLAIQKKRFIPLGHFTEIAKDVFRREFQYATVYINNATTTKTVNFSASYTMTHTGSWSASTVTSYAIPARSGLIISTTKTDIP